MNEAFIFDMDGVLLDSESLYDKCWLLACKEFDVDEKEALALRMACLGKTEGECIKALEKKFASKKDFNAEAFYKRTDDLALDSDCPPKPFAKEVLELLSAKKIPFCLATSSNRDSAKKMLKGAGLLSFFNKDNSLCADDYENMPSKPKPDIYLAACKKISFLPQRSYAVEDSPAGIESAVTAGLKAIMIPDRLEPNDFCLRKAWKILPTLKDLL